MDAAMDAAAMDAAEPDDVIELLDSDSESDTPPLDMWPTDPSTSDHDSDNAHDSDAGNAHDNAQGDDSGTDTSADEGATSAGPATPSTERCQAPGPPQQHSSPMTQTQGECGQGGGKLVSGKVGQPKLCHAEVAPQ